MTQSYYKDKFQDILVSWDRDEIKNTRFCHVTRTAVTLGFTID